MPESKFIPFEREQFALLREAKRLISDEFNLEIKLQNKGVLNEIWMFSKKSKQPRLNAISEQLRPRKSASDSQEDSEKQTRSTSHDEIAVGDLVGGKRCVGFYRGQPVFK